VCEDHRQATSAGYAVGWLRGVGVFIALRRSACFEARRAYLTTGGFRNQGQI
jgi:hypothetical protein